MEAQINQNGQWVVNEGDLKAICYGAGIYSCGGGGDPEVGFNLVKDSAPFFVVSVQSLSADGFLGDPVLHGQSDTGDGEVVERCVD